MAFKDSIIHCRSYRRFYQDYKIDESTLRELVDLARISASAGNLQPLKYIISSNPAKNNLIFSALKWAAYLKDWHGPKEGEQPAAHIIVLADTSISKYFQYDCGIAAQSILLGAVDKGLGGCIVASVDRDILRKNLNIPGQYEILLVIALGKPREKVVIEKVKNGDIKYFRDKNDVHHVPKKSLDEIILTL